MKIKLIDLGRQKINKVFETQDKKKLSEQNAIAYINWVVRGFLLSHNVSLEWSEKEDCFKVYARSQMVEKVKILKNN